jgi:hypothetical protein
MAELNMQKLALFVVIMCASLGCGSTEILHRDPAQWLSPARKVVLAQFDVTVGEFSDDGNFLERENWTAAARESLVSGLEDVLRGNGIELVPAPEEESATISAVVARNAAVVENIQKETRTNRFDLRWNTGAPALDVMER